MAQAYAFAAAGRSAEGLDVLEFLPDSGNEVPVSETDALIMRGMLSVYLDDLAGGIADLGVAAARIRTGLPASYPVHCLTHLSDAHFRHGDWDAANTYAQLATSLAQDADRPMDLARAHARAAQVLSLQGQWSSAQAHVRAARDAAQRFPLAIAVANAAMAAASLASARDDPAGVLAATEPVRAPGMLGVGGLPGMFNWRALEADALIRLESTRRSQDRSRRVRSGNPSGRFALGSACPRSLSRELGCGDRGSGAGEGRCSSRRTRLNPPYRCPSNEPSSDLTTDGACVGSRTDQGRSLQLEGAHKVFSDSGCRPLCPGLRRRTGHPAR